MDLDTLRKVEKLAREFKYCLDCGSENIDIAVLSEDVNVTLDEFFCNDCQEKGFNVGDALCFADKIKKLIKELEEKKLTLARFKTLNPEGKIMLG